MAPATQAVKSKPKVSSDSVTLVFPHLVMVKFAVFAVLKTALKLPQN